jgi:hypothetical protein
VREGWHVGTGPYSAQTVKEIAPLTETRTCGDRHRPPAAETERP